MHSGFTRLVERTSPKLRSRTLFALIKHKRSLAVMASGIVGDKFYLDAFAMRQWDDPDYQGSRMHCDKAEFVRRVHQAHASGAPLIDGYAPFCKHIFVSNFAGAAVGCVPFTDAIAPHIKTGYVARRPDELAVLSRWVTADSVHVPQAKFLDVILYSREQIVKEVSAMPGKGAPTAIPNVPWGIISVKAQDEDHETPMQPITMMRNALGVDEGGSGVRLDKHKYAEAVAYWKERVPVQ